MTSRKLHKCSECHKDFFLESSLKIHALKHQKVKEPFRHLKHHGKGHVKENIIESEMQEVSKNNIVNNSELWNFQCNTCFSVFKNHADLLKHSKMHSEERKPTRCLRCRHTFPSEDLLRKHVHQESFECEVCKTTFRSCNDMKFHIKIHSPPNKFVCNICSKEFKSLTLLEKHKLIHTDTQHCSLCNKQVKNVRALNFHMSRAHSENRQVSCSICGKMYDKNYIKNHLHTHSKTKRLNCHICGLSFKHQNYLSLHMKRHTHPKGLDCDVCGKKFSLRKNLLSHKKIHSQESECTFCHKKIKNDRCLKRHINEKHSNSGDGNKAQCDLCGHMFHKQYLKTHINIHLGKKNYKCNQCDKSFASSTYLLHHIRTHSRDKKYKCNLCGKMLSSRVSLKIHHKIHQGVKPYKCSLCPLAFIRAFQLKSHMFTHSKKKYFSCQVCGQKFSHRRNIKPHYSTHSPEELQNLDPSILKSLSNCFKCKVCSKTFYQKFQLIAHVRIHTGENPYSCSVCGRSFRLMKLLTVHLKSHSKAGKSYQCDVCKKYFKSNVSLKKHLILHNNSTTYLCFVCGQFFSSKAILDFHLETHSQDIPSHQSLECFTCDVCEEMFTEKSSYETHQKSCMNQKVICSESNVEEIYNSNHFASSVTEEIYATETISELERTSGIDCNVPMIECTDNDPLDVDIQPTRTQVIFKLSEDSQSIEEGILVHEVEHAC